MVSTWPQGSQVTGHHDPLLICKCDSKRTSSTSVSGGSAEAPLLKSTDCPVLWRCKASKKTRESSRLPNMEPRHWSFLPYTGLGLQHVPKTPSISACWWKWVDVSIVSVAQWIILMAQSEWVLGQMWALPLPLTLQSVAVPALKSYSEPLEATKLFSCGPP